MFGHVKGGILHRSRAMDCVKRRSKSDTSTFQKCTKSNIQKVVEQEMDVDNLHVA